MGCKPTSEVVVREVQVAEPSYFYTETGIPASALQTVISRLDDIETAVQDYKAPSPTSTPKPPKPTPPPKPTKPPKSWWKKWGGVVRGTTEIVAVLIVSITCMEAIRRTPQNENQITLLAIRHDIGNVRLQIDGTRDRIVQNINDARERLTEQIGQLADN
jgi:hypothetical protein